MSRNFKMGQERAGDHLIRRTRLRENAASAGHLPNQELTEPENFSGRFSTAVNSDTLGRNPGENPDLSDVSDPFLI